MVSCKLFPPLRALRLGLSACLLGAPVRYDGGHKRNPLLTEEWARWTVLVPICPEAEAGLGVPRRPMRLEQTGGSLSLVTFTSPRRDFTAVLRAMARRTLPAVADLDGYVLKSRSPSCGWQSVPVFSRSGLPISHGSGVFAAQIVEHCPELPVIEADQLDNPHDRERFLVAACARRRWRAFTPTGLEAGCLRQFHRRESLLLRAYLGRDGGLLRRLATAQEANVAALDEYGPRVVTALRTVTRRPAHEEALRIALRYLQRRLGRGRCRDLEAKVTQLTTGQVELGQILMAFRACIEDHQVTALAEQSYFAWDPTESAMRFGI